MFFRFLLLVVLSSTTLLLSAQSKAVAISQEKNKDRPLSFFDYMIADSISEIRLTADFSTLRRNRYKEDYYTGQLQFLDNDDSIQNYEVALRTRGKSRKKVCYYPALKLKLSKKELKQNGLSNDNKYKMVCQCKAGKSHQQSLLREYIAYKIYNLISPNSFRVHLLKLNYKDTSTRKEEKRYAFFLESAKGLEERLDGKIIDREKLELSKISRKESIQLSIFQYMIANTDWNIIALHNVKLLLDQNNSIIPIPYDYDYSGLADTPYATPNPDYQMESVRDRYFLSDGYTKTEINKALVNFHEQKEEVEELVSSFNLLSKKSKRHTLRFLKDFYKTIEKPKRVTRELVK
ncbi:MAG: hypothetical protein AB8F74_22985 [Saprospiraceae bacterium]